MAKNFRYRKVYSFWKKIKKDLVFIFRMISVVKFLDKVMQFNLK